MKNRLIFGACSAGLATTALLGGAPAQAQFMGCGAGSTSAMALFSSLTSGAVTSCQVGDKIYSDFNFTIGTTDPNANIILGNPIPDQHTLTASAGAWSNGTFSYKITAVGPEQITGINFDTQSSLFGKGYNWTAGAPELGVAPAIALNQSTPSAGPFFGGPTTVLNVSHELTNTANPMQGWTDTVIQTPGPLPILGAGAAFGFSRKLRRRIKASA